MTYCAITLLCYDILYHTITYCNALSSTMLRGVLRDGDTLLARPAGAGPARGAPLALQDGLPGARRGTDGVGTNGVTAFLMFFRQTFWVLPLTYFDLPKGALPPAKRQRTAAPLALGDRSGPGADEA